MEDTCLQFSFVRPMDLIVVSFLGDVDSSCYSFLEALSVK